MAERSDPRSLLTDEMRACVGREFRHLTSHPVSANDIRRWAIAVHWPARPPRRFWDGGDDPDALVAPEDFNPFAWSTADPPLDAAVPAMRVWPEPELGLPDPPTRAYILAEVSATYGEVPIRPGDVIRSTTRLAGYREREGRLGLMLYTTQEERWVNQRDEWVRTSSTTVVRYR